MGMFVHVTPATLEAQAAQMADIMAELSTQISGFSTAICATFPAGADDASLLAANNFSLHGLNFVGVGTESQMILGAASATTVHAGSLYAGQDMANTTLL